MNKVDVKNQITGLMDTSEYGFGKKTAEMENKINNFSELVKQRDEQRQKTGEQN